MAHLQYMPGDPRLVDQLVYELKSKGIFDQFRKDCIADVDTRPAYQNLRQRVENSVSTFLSRQTWQPDLNKNQLREKLRKHILDGNYLEQGVERIVDQVVNPKVSTVFIPKVEDLVYNYLGITRKKSVTAETSNGKVDDLLPTDLEAVSPGSVKSNDDKNDDMEIDNVQEENKMDIDEEKSKNEVKEDATEDNKEEKTGDIDLPNSNSNSDDKSNIPLPSEEIKPENIPSPDNSPPKVELEKIELPKTPIVSTDIPLPEDINKDEKDKFFKPINSDDDDSSSDSSLRRNMSPLTPIRNFNNENSCDAQQGFENDVELKGDVEKEPSSFKFAIDAKSENNTEVVKEDKKETDVNLSYQFNNQVNINNFNTPLYEDSSNSNNLQIDYESDANSKAVADTKVTESESNQNSEELKKERKPEEKKSNHKSSHRSRDSHKHSSSKDKRSDSKQSSSRDSKNDKSRSSKDESKSKSSDKDRSRSDRSRDRSDKKDSRDSSRHRSSHKSSHKDSKSHRSSSSSHKHSSKHSDEKKSSSSSSQKDKDKSDKSMDKPKDSKSTSHRSDKDRKSSSSSSKSDKNSKHKHDDKNKKTKKETDDHYSLSGRNNPNRRSTDRDSNDGSSSSKGSNHPSSSKSSVSKKESKSSSKSESTSTSGDSTSPSDKENVVQDHGTKANDTQNKPIRIESHLEQPVMSPPRLPFVPDVTIKKPKFAANLEEAKRLMKMRKFLDEEQKRMNQEAVLLLEFQANVRPSLSQVYSNISGPELEFACVTNTGQDQELMVHNNDNISNREFIQETHYTNNQLLNVLNDATIEVERNHQQIIQDEPDKISNVSEICNKNDNNINVHENNTIQANIDNADKTINILKNDDDVKNSDKSIEIKTEFEITIVAEELSENEEPLNNGVNSKIKLANKKDKLTKKESHINGEVELHYFAEHEKYNAEIETAKFSNFLKEYTKTPSKLYLINCDSYEENVIRNESKKFGNFEIVSYQKNGHLKLPKVNNVIKNVNISTEISLPIDNDYDESLKSSVFSPDKSECSFELSDYDAKLEEMVNKTSRQEIMEIILGNANASPSKMPTIDYFTESKIDNDIDNNLKRKMNDESINNNRHVLTPNKIRRLSTEQITSTTQENEEIPNKLNNTRSKYLGKAKRVGLPRPKRTVLPNSPSSDKSVENYEQNTAQTPNGKIKRNKVQRYDTSDLYKPKLHFLSRRNPVT